MEMSTPSTSRDESALITGSTSASSSSQGMCTRSRTQQAATRRLRTVEPSGKITKPLSKKSLADTLSHAQRDSVWPSPDPKISGDDRVFRQLRSAEEVTTPVRDYCAHVQREVQPYMRKIVIGWMSDVCTDAHVDMEVLPLAVNYLDRFLSVEQIYQTQLQALATACLWLASKIKSPKPFDSTVLCNYTDSAVEMGPLMSWELLVLGRLNWDVASITLVDYLEPMLHRMQLPFEKANQIRVAFRCLIPTISNDYKLCSLGASMQAAVAMSIVTQYNMRHNLDNVLEHERLVRIAHGTIYSMLKRTMMSYATETYRRVTDCLQEHDSFATPPSCTKPCLSPSVSGSAGISLSTPPRSPDSAYGSEAYCTPSPTVETMIGQKRRGKREGQ